LAMKTFLRLLTVQLQTQNPLAPMKDTDFFAQLSQLGTVQGMDQLKASMTVSTASAIMGRHVTAIRPMTDSGAPNNTMVSGVAVRLTNRSGTYYLGIQDVNGGGVVDVPMDTIRTVQP
ncbi:MAG: hypothetical protein HY248_05165, partial [Fimbriimonas ginsengisoli]|nr:hypothetical protein [Fimbriimonas ginsengisoli]